MISGNTANPGSGGGVWSWEGTFTMSDGEISNNNALNRGGGVFSYSGTFDSFGGEILNNTAREGNDVYTDDL